MKLSNIAPELQGYVKELQAAVKAKNVFNCKRYMERIPQVCESAGMTVPKAELKELFKAAKAVLADAKANEKKRLEKLHAFVMRAQSKARAKAVKDARKYEQGPDYIERNSQLSMRYYPTQGVFKSSSGKNYFDLEKLEATSYDWWIYVMVIKGKVIFNDHSYSMTTNKHQSDMRSLLKELGIKVDAWVSVAEGLQKFESCALEPVYQKMYQAQIDLNNPKRKKALDTERQNIVKQCLKEIKFLRTLGAKYSPSDAKDLRESMVKSDAERREKMRKEREATAAMVKQVKKQNAVFEPAAL